MMSEDELWDWERQLDRGVHALLVDALPITLQQPALRHPLLAALALSTIVAATTLGLSLLVGGLPEGVPLQQATFSLD